MKTTRQKLSKLASLIWDLPEGETHMISPTDRGTYITHTSADWRLFDTTGGHDNDGNPEYQAWCFHPNSGEFCADGILGIIGSPENGWQIYCDNEPLNDEVYGDFEAALRRVLKLMDQEVEG